MIAVSRRSPLLTSAAGKDALLRLLTQSSTLQSVRLPMRTFASARTYLQPTRQQSGHLGSSRSWRSFSVRRLHGIRNNSTKSAETTQQSTTQTSPPKKESKLKELFRRYGWAATGVYLSLSALDFPFCFLAVRWLGTERIAAAEEWVVDSFWTGMEKVAPGSREGYGRWRAGLSAQWAQFRGLDKVKVPAEEPVENAAEVAEDVAHHHGASIWTQLVLAYALHKSLLVFRVPLTISITPGIVKYLRKRGWNIGKPKAPPSPPPANPPA
ncbi:DUF1279 super [Recurvomyces mirabilis]|nr:DUF1279 super [Recurvomyces mirabilis]